MPAGSRGPSCVATGNTFVTELKKIPLLLLQPKVYFPSLAPAARPRLTPLYQAAEQAGGTGSSPSPRHWAPPGGQAEARLGYGPTGGLTSAGPMAGQGCGVLETGPAVASLG